MGETRPHNALDLCRSCQAVTYERDRFCRHCGMELGVRAQLAKRATTDSIVAPSVYVTAPLTPLPERRSVSAPLVRLVTTELSALHGNGWARRVALVLLSLPIWLMLILLSPFDAYAATKAVAQRL